MEDFFKFPRTRHIIDMGSVGRDDLVMDKKEAQVFFENPVVIEEKVDGANLGISITDDYKLKFQNRSHLVTGESAVQWKGLEDWAKNHPGIWSILTSPDIVIFGEWMMAKHSIHYTHLPDYFLAFDIYEKNTGRFLSHAEKSRRFEEAGLAQVPVLRQGVTTREQLIALLESKSSFRDGVVEGAYVRIDDAQYLVQRGKVVRSDFIATPDAHWTKAQFTKNVVRY
jgi:atypical dual specificity phosphatase